MKSTEQKIFDAVQFHREMSEEELLADIDAKLAEAEEELRQGKGINARAALSEIRKEYNI